MPLGPTGHSVIALDVGGTVMKGIALDASGHVIGRPRWRTPREEPGLVLVAVKEAMKQLVSLAGSGVRAAGLVVPGLVSEDRGVVLHARNLGWRDIRLRELVEEHIGLPVALGHDVRSAGLAEVTLGAATGCRTVLVVPIGTGISAAVVTDGSLLTGVHVGEIGHVQTRFPEPCVCGSLGCLEAVASASAITRRYQAAGGVAASDSYEVAKLVAAKDPIACSVWAQAIEGLATVLSSCAALLAPERIVIAGGLSMAGEILLGRLRDEIRERLPAEAHPEICASRLGDEAGCLGAALMALSLVRAIGTPAEM